MKTTKTIKFNKSSLDAIPTPEKRTKYYSDEVKGLVLEITPKGAKSFRVLYSHNYTSKAYTIGSYPDITPSVAITRAKELRALITQGLDPQAEKKEKQKEHTFKSFFIKLKPKDQKKYGVNQFVNLMGCNSPKEYERARKLINF